MRQAEDAYCLCSNYLIGFNFNQTETLFSTEHYCLILLYGQG